MPRRVVTLNGVTNGRERWSAVLTWLAHGCSAECTIVIPSGPAMGGYGMGGAYMPPMQYGNQMGFGFGQYPAGGLSDPSRAGWRFLPLGVYMPGGGMGGGFEQSSFNMMRPDFAMRPEYSAGAMGMGPRGRDIAIGDSEVKAQVTIPAVIKTKTWVELANGTVLDSEAARSANMTVTAQ